MPIAVGLTPELLPLIVTINLDKGAIEMSKNGVIVKKLAKKQKIMLKCTVCNKSVERVMGGRAKKKIEIKLIC